MLRIRRTKKAPNDALGLVAPATHYAASIAPLGNVTAWTDDRAKAGTFTEEQAGKVREHYASRANVGQLDFEDTAAKPPAPKPFVSSLGTPPPLAAQEKPPPEQPKPGRPRARREEES